MRLGEANIIEDVVENYAKDDFVEEVVCGQLLSISEGNVDSPYMVVSDSRTLSKGDHFSVFSCADM